MLVRVIFEGEPEAIGELINTLPDKLFNKTFKSQGAVPTEAARPYPTSHSFEAIRELKNIMESAPDPDRIYKLICANEIIYKAIKEVGNE